MWIGFVSRIPGNTIYIFITNRKEGDVREKGYVVTTIENKPCVTYPGYTMYRGAYSLGLTGYSIIFCWRRVSLHRILGT